jgi:hypothetical protein
MENHNFARFSRNTCIYQAKVGAQRRGLSDSQRVKELVKCTRVREIREVLLRVAFRSDVNFAYFPNTYTKVAVCSQVLVEIIEDLSMFKKQRVFLEHVCTLCVFQAKFRPDLPFQTVKISRRFP